MSAASEALKVLADSIDWADQSPVTWVDLKEKIEKAAQTLEGDLERDGVIIVREDS